MKYKLERMPIFMMGHDGIFEVYNYELVLIPYPESKKEQRALEE